MARRHLPAYPDRVTAPDLKADLIDHLGRLNQAVLHKLEGLSEYELRRAGGADRDHLLGAAFLWPA